LPDWLLQWFSPILWLPLQFGDHFFCWEYSFFCRTGVWTQDLTILGRRSISGATSPALFSILWGQILVFGFSSFHFLLVVLRFWTQGLTIMSQVIWSLSHLSKPFFAFGYFSDRFLHFLPEAGLGPTFASPISGIKDVYHYTWLVIWNWVSWTFSLDYSWTVILLFCLPRSWNCRCGSLHLTRGSNF
jgi:hypothetical protein